MLLARGNLARQMLLPDMINFVDPNLDPGPQIREVNNRILRGMSVTAATSEENPGSGMAEDRAMANVLADKEDFNTRYGSLNGWREAVRRVKPTLRVPAQFSLSALVLSAQPKTTTEVVNIMLGRFLSVPLAEKSRLALVDFLNSELGTSDVQQATTYMEDPLRLLVHLIMSTPEYQLA
jgi:hypothetical protein